MWLCKLQADANGLIDAMSARYIMMYMCIGTTIVHHQHVNVSVCVVRVITLAPKRTIACTDMVDQKELATNPFSSSVLLTSREVIGWSFYFTVSKNFALPVNIILIPLIYTITCTAAETGEIGRSRE